jgi:ATP-dependent Zn protease
VKNDIEIQNNRADYSVLYQLSQQTGGQFYSTENYGTLIEFIKNNKQIAVQQQKQTLQTEWINLKVLFFLIIILLATEWFFRKYWGIY